MNAYRPLHWHIPGIILMTFFLVLAAGGNRPAAAKDDWQWWHETKMLIDVYENVTLRVKGEQRFRDDFTDLFLNNIDAGILWESGEHFEIGPFFKYEHEKGSTGRHVNENRWYLEGTFKWKAAGFDLSDRNRIAYRNRNTSDTWRYRNRVKVAYPLSFNGIDISPYVADEIFWDIGSHELNQNRFSGGLGFRLNRHVGFSLYYLLRSSKAGADWNDFHVLGTEVSFYV